jgi:hypothetical protein
MKQSVLTIIEAVVFTMILGVAAVFFGASLVSAAEVSTTNQSGSNREITQGDLGRAVISDVTRSSTTSADGRTTTRTIRFTITADDANVYIPTATSGRGGAIVWKNTGLRAVTATLSSEATTEGGKYVVNEGESETFTITYTTTGRSELNVQAIRFSNSVTGRLWTAQFPKAERGTLPEKGTRPVATTSPVASTSPVKVFCVSGGQNFPAGTERTSIINASGTTSVLTDAHFICRIKDGRGVWEREGSLPGKPTNPMCIKGTTSNNSGQASGGMSLPRRETEECLGGTSSSTGSTGSSTGMTGGTGTPKPGVLPKLCKYLDKMYTDGTRQPTTVGSMSFTNSRTAPLVCQNGEWKPVKPQPNAGPATTTHNGLPSVRGASTDVRVQMAAILFAMQEFLDEIKNQQ